MAKAKAEKPKQQNQHMSKQMNMGVNTTTCIQANVSAWTISGPLERDACIQLQAIPVLKQCTVAGAFSLIMPLGTLTLSIWRISQ